MAHLNTRWFALHPAPAWPRPLGLRLGLYLGLTLATWLVPPWGALAALALVLGLGRHLPWRPWLAALGWMWTLVLAPLALALPGALHHTASLAPAAWRSLTFLALLAASRWFSATTSVLQIRMTLEWVFRLFGRRAAASLSLAGALALGFLPWVEEQVRACHQAALLRGLPKGQPLLLLRALPVPIFIRMLSKARHTADALELRGQ